MRACSGGQGENPPTHGRLCTYARAYLSLPKSPVRILGIISLRTDACLPQPAPASPRGYPTDNLLPQPAALPRYFSAAAVMAVMP